MIKGYVMDGRLKDYIDLCWFVDDVCCLHNIGEYIFYDEKKEIEKDSEPGIYLIIKDRYIKYIGTAEDLKTRFHGHKKYKAGDKIMFFPMLEWKTAEIKRIQHGLICLLNPKDNNMSKYDRIN